MACHHRLRNRLSVAPNRAHARAHTQRPWSPEPPELARVLRPAPPADTTGTPIQLQARESSQALQVAANTSGLQIHGGQAWQRAQAGLDAPGGSCVCQSQHRQILQWRQRGQGTGDCRG
jgi:hypothetical protein